MNKEALKRSLRKNDIIKQMPKACSDELHAVEFLEHHRWGDKPTCAHCGSEHVYQMLGRDGGRNKRFLWRCKACTKQYTVRIGTVFEDSRIPLRHWCFAFWRACTAKKGVSALEIKRQIQVSYKSALFMMHRIRFAMSDDGPGFLTGTVEIDETYVGGKVRHKTDVETRKKLGWRGDNKTPVVAIVQRGGNIRTMTAPKVNSRNIKEFVRGNVHKTAHIMTDESPFYHGLGKKYASHETITHSAGEYARGDVTTNTVEGFFSLLKRGIHGSYHAVSKQHLHRYLAEFEYRYNTREWDDGERTAEIIRKAVGKRLVYKAI
ncbi:MAG: IS1595 family transposase [Gammaproteobacteria bacterium]|nr:IS1595 family transposase [Gammaproteobacteria bacterium]